MTLILPPINPSYAQGWARHPGEAKYPELWRGLVAAYSPELGVRTKILDGRLPDTSGMGAPDLEIVDIVGFPNGPRGPVLSTDQTNFKIRSVSAFNVLDHTNVAAVSFWGFYPTTPTGDDLFFESTQHQAGFSPAFIIDPGDNTGFMIGESNTTGALFQEWTKPSAGVWHHYVCSFDNSTESGDCYLWIDGVDQGAGTKTTDTKTGTANWLTGRQCYMHSRAIGSLQITGKSFGWRFYDYLPTDSEAKMMFEHDIHEPIERRFYFQAAAAASTSYTSMGLLGVGS